MEGFLREAMDAGALGMSTGLEFNPGPGGDHGRARPAERGRGRVRRDLHEPRPQPRRRHPRRDRRVPRGRPRRRDPRRDLAPERAAQHRRARPRLGAGGRADGGGARGRGWTSSPTRRRSARASASSPGSCRRGSRPTGREAALARLRDPDTAATAAHRVRPLLALRPQGRVGAGAPPGERAAPRVGRAHVRADRRRCAKADPWDCFFDVLADAGRRVRERPRRRDALHRRAPRRDDLAPALLPRRRHLHGHARGPARRRPAPSARLRGARPLPHAPRPRERHAAPRGGDPEDDEHAGGALRPLGSRPAARRLRGRRRRLRLRRARRRVDDRRSAPLRARGRARARERDRSSSTAASTPARGPGGTCSAR